MVLKVALTELFLICFCFVISLKKCEHSHRIVSNDTNIFLNDRMDNRFINEQHLRTANESNFIKKIVEIDRERGRKI